VSENPTRGVRFGLPVPHSAHREGLGTGTEPPAPEWIEVAPTLDRWFAFVDVCGFTSFTEQQGARAATEVLSRFRGVVRIVTARRGVRVLKWLGDGVMLVGVEAGPVVAAALELVMRFRDDPFEVHAGIAGGPVLLFEGDDYIGPSVNHAARLCDAAGPGQVLAIDVQTHLPDWVAVADHVTVDADGIGPFRPVARLEVRSEALAADRTVA
jgi:adenylate cyclase